MKVINLKRAGRDSVTVLERALFIFALVVLAIVAIFFACAWHFRLMPLGPDWGVWGTWVGSLGTILGFFAAIMTLVLNEKTRQKDYKEAQLSQGRMVAITSTLTFQQAPIQWRDYLERWPGVRAGNDLLSEEEKKYREEYDGPWDGKIEWEVQNSGAYPIVDLKVSVDETKISPKSVSTAKEIYPPALLSGGTMQGTWSISAKSRPEDVCLRDVLKIEFTDAWQKRWISAGKGAQVKNE